jgi:hypothetical protein
MLNHRVGQLTIQWPAVSVRAPRALWAKRLATILGTAGAKARSKRPLQPLTRPGRCEARGNRAGARSLTRSRTSSSATASNSVSVLAFRNGDTGAVSRGGGGGFTGIFEIVAAGEAGVVG